MSKETSTKKLEKLRKDVQQAENAMVAELKRLWPEATQIQAILRAGQYNPSTMTVVGYDGRYGCVRAAMPSERSRCGQFVKDVRFQDIVGPWR